MSMYRCPNSTTLHVNLFAQPGAGKSTGAAYVFSELKMLGISCELVQEFAKTLCWEQGEEGIHPTLTDQIYMFAKQRRRMTTLEGKVDVVITDSPILLSNYYGNTSSTFKKLVQEENDKFKNLNVWVTRVKPYDPKGRLQTEEESDAMAADIKQLAHMDLTIDGDKEGYTFLVDEIVKLMR